MQNCNWLSKTPTRRRGDAAKPSDASGLLPPPCGLPADAWPSRVAGVSQVRHPSWKWSASGMDARRRASNSSLKSTSSLVRAWSLCPVGQRAGEALFDLRARGAAQRRSRSVSCWRSGGLYQRQQQHDVGRRECRPPGALRVAARTVAARHRRQRWLAATPGVQRRLMVSSSDCAARRLAERLRGAVRTA